MKKARLEDIYLTKIRPELQSSLGLSNVMSVPKLSKIVINVGVKGSVADSKALQPVLDVVQRISGQRPVRTIAKKSIASFKLREGMPIGVKVTLRKRNMYEFLDKLINLALPKVRDFRGVTNKMDGRGSYNLGIKEWNIFPELGQDTNEKMHGLNITIHIQTKVDAHGHALLKSFGMPFRKN